MAENGAMRIRLGMVGGGTGAFIGYVHRVASRIDGDYDLVAGALSSRPDVAKESGRNIGLAEDRIYTSYEEMARAEAARPDGIQAVSIVTLGPRRSRKYESRLAAMHDAPPIIV